MPAASAARPCGGGEGGGGGGDGDVGERGADKVRFKVGQQEQALPPLARARGAADAVHVLRFLGGEADLNKGVKGGGLE